MNATRKIALLLAVVFLLPALFFSGYELSSQNKNEAIIQEAYNRQLDAILFSVNQYSDDILNRWITQVEGGLSTAPSTSGTLDNLLMINGALSAVFMIDTVDHRAVPRVYALDSSMAEEVRRAWENPAWQNTSKINQLLSYKRSGFRKVDVLNGPPIDGGNFQWLVFIIENSRQAPRIAGTLIEPEVFVEELVGPRLQEIARDQFVLSVVRLQSGTTIYNTAPRDTAKTITEAFTKEFWLFPDYALGIRPKGSSIQQVINDRTTTNLVLLLSVDLLLILAVVLVFRNVKKEVQLAQNKSDFVANVSHEIRTPLALISMFAETLEMGRVKSEEKKQEYYTIIHKEAHRLSGIVNKILNFSQAEANKKPLTIEPLHPDTEINEILKTYDFHLSNKGFVYTFTGSPDLHILADRQAFIEVIINLIDNAIKYSPDQKRIEISCHRGIGVGLIAIKDFGIGISKADQKHVFDKFYRVTSGNLAQTRGTGLGLSLVKQLMDAQRGSIALESEPGKGSTFTLSFPLESN
ncbi:MAG: HAMP domain-containing histidine kinase [Cyclobacteriaceae bacterium]|nr:HAMP domain-containing histidine kinase [Cyclobacteriaceae bacterium]